jgi:hypothetical protein
MKHTWRRGLFLTAYCLAPLAAACAASPKMPTFFARRDYAGLYSYWGQVADTNGDGIPDLIAVNGGYVQVLFGNGDGTFRPGTNTLTVAGGAFSLAATDLNGDGRVDLAQANGNSVAVCMGNGDGTFQSGVLYPINDSNVQYLVVGDFNGDHIQDIAVTGNMGVWLLTGKGDGTFNPAALVASLPSAYHIAAADFNGDHKLDLAVVGAVGTGFSVLLGNGNGTFQAPRRFAQPSLVGALAVGALTKGGYPGIAISSQNNNIYLFFGNGDGSFSGPHYVNLPGAGSDGLAIGDVNGDGIPDLVSSGVSISYGEGGGKFTKPVSYVVDGASFITNMVLADLRNNGLADIVTNGYSTISVLLSEGKGKFEDGVWTAVAGGAGCGVTADFNGDGKPDLAVNNPQGISILLGTGKAAKPFTTGTSIALAGAGCVITGDLNGDGIPDLLAAVNGSPNALLAYLGNGDGTFTLKSTTPTPNSGGIVVLADFNHDGKLDFATSGNLLALGNGDGTFQAPTAIVANPPTTGFSGIAAGDINNDGWTDLVLTNNAVPYNNAFVLLNNQHGGFTQVPTNFGATTTQPILVDLNGDGNLDLVLEGGGVFVGNGTGTFTYRTALPGVPGGSNGGVIAVADVNGDGIPDLLVTGFDTLTVSLGEKGVKYATPFYIGTGPAPNDILVANLHGQSATKGLPDIVAPDGSGGVMVLTNLTK